MYVNSVFDDRFPTRAPLPPPPAGLTIISITLSTILPTTQCNSTMEFQLLSAANCLSCVVRAIHD